MPRAAGAATHPLPRVHSPAAAHRRWRGQRRPHTSARARAAQVRSPPPRGQRRPARRPHETLEHLCTLATMLQRACSSMLRRSSPPSHERSKQLVVRLSLSTRVMDPRRHARTARAGRASPASGAALLLGGWCRGVAAPGLGRRVGSGPAIARSRLDLPQPLGPVMSTAMPGFMRSVKPWRICERQCARSGCRPVTCRHRHRSCSRTGMPAALAALD